MFSHKHGRFAFLIVSGLFIFTAFNGVKGANLSSLCLSNQCISAWSEIVTMGAWATSTNGIYYNSGNVGIGTTAPSYPLQVVGTAADWTGGFKNYTAGAYGLSIDLSGSSGTNAALQIYTATGGGFLVKNNGSVGIGTANPGYKLEVGGSIYGTSISGLPRKTFSIDVMQSVKYYLIAYLPVSSGATGESIRIETTGAAIWGDKGKLIVKLGQRNGFWYTKYYEGSNPKVHVRVYRNVDGSSNVYVYTPSPSYTTGEVLYYESGWLGRGSILYDNPTASAVVPSGTLIFDSNDNITYPINESISVGAGYFNGKVGIGTTSPISTLDIPNSADDFYAFNAAIGSLGITGQTSIVMADPEGNLSATSSSSFFTPIVTTSGGWTANGTTVYKTNNNGNVGIGTTNPNRRLEVGAGGAGSTSEVVLVNGGATGVAGTYFAQNGTIKSIFGLSGGNGDFIPSAVNGDFNIRNSQKIAFSTDAGLTASMVILANGSVGVGTTNPVVRLQVVGVNSAEPTLGTAAGAASFLSADSLYGAYIGVNPTSGSSWIQAMRNDSATAYNLNLQPSGGNVGVGTTAPSEKLDVSGAIRFTGQLTNLVANSGTMDVISGVTRLMATGPNISTGGTLKLITMSSNTGVYNEALTIINNGNVGIGSITPVAKLHISTSASGNTLLLYSNNTLPFGPAVLQNISSSNTNNLTETSIGLNLENSSQTANTYSPLISFSRHSTSGSYNGIYGYIGGYAAGDSWATESVYGDLVFGTGSVNSNGPLERLRITSDGNVGIGTTNPLYTLDIPTMDSSLFVQNAIIGSLGVASQNSIVMADQDGYLSAASLASLSLDLWGGTKNGNIWNGAAGAGNVGIGTTAPVGKLDVNGTGGFVVSGTNLDPSGGYNLVPLQSSGKLLTGWNYSAGRGEIDLVSNRAGGDIGGFRFYDYTNAGVMNNLMTIQGAGNVGIETTNPLSTLSVGGSGVANYGIYGSGVNGIYAATGSGGTAVYATGGPTGNGGYDFYAANTAGRSYFAGKVGIGTASPGQKLSVKTATDENFWVRRGSDWGAYTGLAFDFRNDADSASIPLRIRAGTLILDTGNVGIGTNIPLYTLDIPTMDSSLFVQNAIIGSLGVASQNSIVMADQDGYLSAASLASLSLDLWGGTKNGNIWNGAAGAGNVGIGTTNPTSPLHVEKSVAAGSYVTTIKNTGAGNGLYIYNADWDSTDYLLYAENAGGYKFVVNGNGNVGIGTASPGAKLDILTGTQGSLVYSMFLHSGYYQDGSAIGIGFGSDGNASYTKGGIVYDATGYGGWNRGDIKFLQRNSSDTVAAGLSDAVMTIKNTGNVGIGTTNPLSILSVGGDGIASTGVYGRASEYGLYGAGSGTGGIGVYGSGNAFSFYGPGKGYFGGNVGIGTTDPTRKLTVQGADNGSGQLRLQGTGDSASYWELGRESATTGDFRLVSNRTGTGIITALTIKDTNGNVGIGTTGPSSKLFVNGVIRNSDNVNALGDPGLLITSGDRLGFDQSGTRSWTMKATGGNLTFNSGDSNGYHQFNTGVLVSGSVGIGITSPKGRLNTLALVPIANMTLGSATQPGLSVTASDGNPYGMYFGVNSDGNSWIQAGRTDSATAYNMSLQASGGNVGVGTASPSASKLTIDSNSNNVRIRYASDTRYRSDWFIDSAGSTTFNSYDDTGGAYKPITINASQTTLGMQGSVGIGTASTNAKLHIAGAPAATSGALIYLRDTTAAVGTPSLGGIAFFSNPGSDYYVGKKNDSAGNAWLSFGNADTGSEAVAIDANGNVGIGTAATAAAKLTVAGDVTITGTLKLNGAVVSPNNCPVLGGGTVYGNLTGDSNMCASTKSCAPYNGYMPTYGIIVNGNTAKRLSWSTCAEDVASSVIIFTNPGIYDSTTAFDTFKQSTVRSSVIPTAKIAAGNYTTKHIFNDYNYAEAFCHEFGLSHAPYWSHTANTSVSCVGYNGTWYDLATCSNWYSAIGCS